MGRSLAAALLVLLAACTSAPPHAARSTFEAGGVRVELRWSQSSGRLAATFTPTRAGFHLYSVDLPAGGVDGLGQRTEVALSGGLRATGAPRADRAVRSLAIPLLHVVLPVYPNGPVTVSVPVRRSGGRAVVEVSYGACSDSTCLAPVLRRHVTLTV